MKSAKPKVIGLFSGCGGLDLGFHKQGYDIVWANDYHEWAAKTYRRNLSNVMHKGDIPNSYYLGYFDHLKKPNSQNIWHNI